MVYIKVVIMDLKEFCYRFKIYNVRKGQPYKQVDPYPMQFATRHKDFYADYSMRAYEVSTTEITISDVELDKLMTELDEIKSRDYHEFVNLKKQLGDGFMYDFHRELYSKQREERVRSNTPAVQKAWDNYQLMLKLAGYQ